MTTSFQPGDIVFFRWDGSIPDPDFTYFANLAGFAQDLGYEDGRDRWHHHCGIIATDGQIVQFPVRQASTSPYGDPLVKERMTTPRGERFDVVRSREDGTGERIAEHAESLVGTPYNVGALLGFAFATQKRLFGPGRARDRLADLAAGSHTIASGEGHTCVSAVLASLAAVEGEPRVFAEPPARTRPPVLSPADPPVLNAVFQQLLDTVATSPLAQSLGTLGRLDDEDLFSEAELFEGFTGGEPTDEVQALHPGHVRTTKQYLELMTLLVQTMRPGPASRVADVGRRKPLDPGNVPHPLVSPAMLFDALIDGDGFTVNP